jgi:hypothetical protein
MKGLAVKRVLIAAAFALVACTSISGENPKAAAVAVAETEAVVELVALDRKTRTATVRGPAGNTLTFVVPEDAQNLDRVKPGDLFKMRYVEALALALNKGGTASATAGRTVALAPKGGTPGGTIVNTKEITTVVTGVDRKSRTISVQGPAKNEMTLKVADEVRSFDEMAVGDTISLTYTEALVMQMISQPGKGSSPATK